MVEDRPEFPSIRGKKVGLIKFNLTFCQILVKSLNSQVTFVFISDIGPKSEVSKDSLKLFSITSPTLRPCL